MTINAQLKSANIKLRKDGRTYDVFFNSENIGWLEKEKHPGQNRSLRKFVGCYDAWVTWTFWPNNDEGVIRFDSFDEAKQGLFDLLTGIKVRNGSGGLRNK